MNECFEKIRGPALGDQPPGQRAAAGGGNGGGRRRNLLKNGRRRGERVSDPLWKVPLWPATETATTTKFGKGTALVPSPARPPASLASFRYSSLLSAIVAAVDCGWRKLIPAPPSLPLLLLSLLPHFPLDQ
jgi:hypothetical protein